PAEGADAPVTENTPAEVSAQAEPVAEKAPEAVPAAEAAPAETEAAPAASVAEAEAAPAVEAQAAAPAQPSQFDTPHDDFDWSIDKRNVSSYSAEEKEKYDKVYENTFKVINDNEMVTGIVVGLTKTDVVINI